MKLRNLACALACALTLSGPTAWATAVSPNYTDLWWNPAESGWGVTVTQEANVMFLTFFVYGPSNQPMWFTATLNQTVAGSDTSPFTGDLYQTTGPYYGASSFNPSTVVATKVGTVTFTPSGPGNAMLQYSVNSTQVTKQIQRQTLRSDSLVGSYLGGTSDVVTSGCLTPGPNPLVTEDGGVITITQPGGQTIIGAPTCTFVGAYVQQGRMGSLNDATYTCTTGAAGTIQFTELYVEQSGFVGKYTGHDSNTGCNFTGTIGGARRH
jgi:hypothetical protein